eukprot:g21154.t1
MGGAGDGRWDGDRDHSLRDSLVRSILLTSLTTPGTFRCNHRKCYTCPYTYPFTSIQGTKQTFHIRWRFTCTSANVIYCILCSRYGLFYIGETKWRLGDCFVVNHFNSPIHSLDDMSILGLLQCHNDATRKLEERHLIFRLGSLQPDGLNVDFT